MTIYLYCQLLLTILVSDQNIGVEVLDWNDSKLKGEEFDAWHLFALQPFSLTISIMKGGSRWQFIFGKVNHLCAPHNYFNVPEKALPSP